MFGAENSKNSSFVVGSQVNWKVKKNLGKLFIAFFPSFLISSRTSMKRNFQEKPLLYFYSPNFFGMIACNQSYE